MKSLFAQLWLAFLAVTAVTFAASLGLSYAAALKRSGEADLVSPVVLAESAQHALTAYGANGLNGWIVDEIHHQPEISVYFTDPGGREFLGRTVLGQPVPASVGQPPPVVRARDGTLYRVSVRLVRGLVFDFWRMLLRPWALGSLVLAISGVGCALLAWRMSRPV